MTSTTVAGEVLLLLPERAVFWEARKTLLIADPHFGKAASFRAGGIPVPAGTTTQALARIDATRARLPVERIVFLGDFLHAKTGRAPQTLGALQAWRERNAGLQLVLVRGNHDRHAGDPPAKLNIECCNAPLQDGPFAFVHMPGRVAGSYALAGHMHPGALLAGAGRQYERVPCFWFAEELGVLPAFGEFTGLALVEAGAGDRVFVVAEGEILRTTFQISDF